MLRIMAAAPFPEELLDLRHIRAAGDVLDALVVHADHGRADERLAFEVGQLDLHVGLLARLVLRLRRRHLDVQDPLFRRHDHLAHLGVHPAIGDGDGLDEEVRHVALDDGDLLLDALALEPAAVSERR